MTGGAAALDREIAARGGAGHVLQRAEQATRPPPTAQEWVDVVRAWTPPVDLDERPRPVEFVVGQLIARGLVGALVAAGGTGKTTLQLRLGISIATGRPFLGMPVHQGSFVLLSSDDSQDDLDGALARIVRAMRLNLDEVDLVRTKLRVHSLQGLAGLRTFATVAGGSVVRTGLEDLIVEALAGIDDLRLVGLDTLRQFSGGSTNDEQVVKLSISGAQAIAQRTGASVMLSHHTGKANFRDGIDDQYCGSGSAAIADNARFVLLLQRASWAEVEQKMRRTGQESGDPLVLTSTRGSLLVKPPAPVYLYRDGFRMEHIAGTTLTQEQALDKRDRDVLAAVRAGAQTKNDIFQRVGGKRAAALGAVDDLLARGHLSNGTPGGTRGYVLTNTGAKLLEAAE